MFKLTKDRSTQWHGNGMGSSSAVWRVVEHEHIVISELGTGWSAVDSNTMKKLVSGASSRKMCLQLLVGKI